MSKRFSPAARDRRAAEVALLSALAGLLPVPEQFPAGDDEVRTAWVDGILGQAFVAWSDRDMPRQTLRRRKLRFMRACGSFLKRLHSLGTLGLEKSIPGTGTVLCHGDFAPYNVIVDPQRGAIRAVIDWEIGHLGRPVEDLAWMEWGMREWYFPTPRVVAELYRSYGQWFPWSERHEAMIERRRPIQALLTAPGYPAEHRARAMLHWEQLVGLKEIITREMVEG